MNVVKRWLPVVAWSALILSTSSDLFSSAHTSIWIKPEALNAALRKLAHVTGYGILGILAFRAAQIDLRRPMIAALAIVFIVASIDEWHQASIPSRGGSPWDVLLDLAGAALFIAFLVRRASLSSPARVD